MVMVWGLILLALSAMYSSINAQYHGADAGVGFSSDEAQFSSYFNAETCRGGDCGGYGTISDPDEQGDQEPVYPVLPDPVYPDHPVYPQDPVYPGQPVSPEPVYPEHPVYPQDPDHPVYPQDPVYPEPVYPEHPVYPQDPIYPDPEPQYPSSTEYPGMIDEEFCRCILEAVSQIESRHPDIRLIKHRVLEELIKLVVEYSDVESDNCDPAVKLLDFIIMAANKLRTSYIKESDTYCEFQDADEESEYTSSDYDQMEGTGTPYPEVTSPHTVTIEYEPYEEPCTEPSTPGYETSTKPCPEKPVYEPSPEYPYEPSKPCHDKHCGDYIPTEEIIAEDDDHYDHVSPPFVGSHRGIPGVHYPNYTEVPITSFSCADKKYIPGFYADLETRCQVFHVCYEHRRESFLCPIGTIFNQPILACDYWYSSNCSQCPKYYDVNIKTADVPESDFEELPEEVLDELVHFLPVKAKVTVFSKPAVEEKFVPVEKPVSQEVPEIASDIFDKIISTSRVVPKTFKSEVRVHVKKPAYPTPILFKPKAVSKAKFVGKVALAKAAVPVLAKAKIAVPVIAKTKVAAGKVIAAKAAIPVAAAKVIVAGKTIAVKAAVPVVAKAKLATGVKVAVPVAAKAKFAAAAKVAVPAKVLAGKKVAVSAAVPIAVGSAKVAVKAVPVLKGKILAASLPFAKSALLKASIPAVKSVPVMKAKLASVPVVKGKLLALPLAKAYAAPILKAKVVKAAAISPLTKKALALGYMKLLKAKKLALMG